MNAHGWEIISVAIAGLIIAAIVMLPLSLWEDWKQRKRKPKETP